jgi:hypothetical protein
VSGLVYKGTVNLNFKMQIVLFSKAEFEATSVRGTRRQRIDCLVGILCLIVRVASFVLPHE